MNTTRFFSMIFMSLLLGFGAFAQDEAEEAAPAEAPAQEESSTPEKVNMNDLEQKYWAPSDQGYTVVQDRTYSKADKFGFSIMGGPVLMYDWYDGFSFGANAFYHFGERWGIEGQFQAFSLSEIDAVTQVEDLGGTVDRGQINWYAGATGRWVPFYSKMSFLGSKIVYFDMSFGASLGLVSYDQKVISGDENQSTIAVGFDISQTYYITPRFALRVDYAMKFFNEEVVKFNPASAGADPGEDLSSYTTFNIGLTYLL